ncbi:YoaK family protein [Streptomyces sp. NPDC050523]|uniref:YoaK family protein n=1 Tax=Streptomyces sp. NPDC050523 TaxID=3365622 RepID=UPI0037B5AFE6
MEAHGATTGGSIGCDDRERTGAEPAAAPARRAVAAVRQHRLVVPSLLLLTLLSGVVDAVSLLGLGQVFVANMTGNLVLVGLALAGAAGSSPAGPLTALGGFGAGALLVRAVALRHVNHRALVGLCALLEAALFVVAVLTWSHDGVQEPALPPIALCAVALGMQNAAVRRLGVAGLTTTVMTSTLTGLIAGRAEERTPTSTSRQTLSVVTLVAGAALGAAVVQVAGPHWALTTVAALAIVAAFTLLLPGRPSAGSDPAE